MTGETPEDQILRLIGCSALDRDKPRRLGLAVSGGGDSMAMLHLIHDCARERGVQLLAATVDHGLRPEAAEEAGFVAATCARLGIAHRTLRWQGWDHRGNLQNAARAARYRLLAGWAGAEGLDAVALGHTRNDVAETFLMRLGREAGVDGLAAMAPRFARDGVRFLRPLLLIDREDLRGYLARRGEDWREDPSNEDEGFDRVKARKALAALAPLGIDVESLATVALNLRDARGGLAWATAEAAGRVVRLDAGELVFDRTELALLGPEIQRRLLRAAVHWMSAKPYPPSRDKMFELDLSLSQRRDHTLAGCHIRVKARETRAGREPRALPPPVPSHVLWDDRWRMVGPHRAGLTVGALGEAGLARCPDWRATGHKRATLIGSPAIWAGRALVAAPLAGAPRGWRAEFSHRYGDFTSWLFSH